MVRIAIQDGGSPNPATNSYLKTVMDQAIKLNVPMATLTNQIKKFNANDAQLKRFFLEVKAFNRIFIMVEVYTENLPGLKTSMKSVLRKANNSVFADIKHFFDEFGFIHAGNVSGSFASQSEFEDKVTSDAIEVDSEEVEDIDFETKSATFLCRPMDLEKVKRALLRLGYTIHTAEHIFVPGSSIELDEQEMIVYEKLKTKLLEIDGVESVYSNVQSD